MNIRRFIALSDHPVARFGRAAYRGSRSFGVPVPGVLRPVIRALYVAIRAAYHVPMRLLIVEPLIKAHAHRVGRRLRGGVFVPFFSGTGRIVLGDGVNIVGKFAVVFGARFSESPLLEIGNDTGIGHDCLFVVAKEIVIGDHCHIAGGTRISDSNGHQLDPADRLAGLPPSEDDVKPVRIGHNVWIGANATILPGVTIGDNSVVAVNSVVSADVPPNTLVAGYPARQIKKLA